VRFILSSSYNFDKDLPAATVQDLKSIGKGGETHPQMLNRLMSILMHPFIHIGYGFEFGVPGQVAEGELGFSICDYHTSVLNRGRPGERCSPPRRPTRACAALVLFQYY
jgi:hypothetical protein